MEYARKIVTFARTRHWEYYLSKEGIIVSSYGIPNEFRQLFLLILAETRKRYRELFSEHIIGYVEFNVRKSRRLPRRLWTNEADRIFLTLSRKDQLQPAR